MAIKVENLSIHPGDYVFLYVEGNVENSIYITVAADGTAFVSGPFNNKSRSFRCDIHGWVEVSSEERDSAMQTPAVQGKEQG